MKKLLMVLLTFSSVSAFANLDLLAGNYTSAIGNGEATVSKVLVTPANLFEPAVYKYVLNISNDTDWLYLEDETLVASTDGQSLTLNTDTECEDPGCTYFTQIDVTLSVVDGKPSLLAYYDGYQDMEEEDDDNDRYRNFSHKIEYTKK